MRSHLTVAASIAALTLINFFQFPGRTFLQQDTQIYIPMLERLEDPTLLAKDIVATRPHLTFTIYDEVALGLRKLTGASFQRILEAQQLLWRGLGILGVFLIATSLGLGLWPALATAGIYSLGGVIIGPSVLIFEYEPVPRGFAVPLLLFAIGLAAHGRDLGAGAAASLAFLYHPPTTFVFWVAYSALTLWPSRPDWMERRIRGLAPLALAVIVLFVLSRRQPGTPDHQIFFARIDPEWEQWQRFRASYNWVSIWFDSCWEHYALMLGVALGAAWRLWRRMSPELRFFAVGLPVMGALSIPASYLLLDRMKWVFIPQFQPARAVLFITVLAVVMGTAAGLLAAARGVWWEAVLWLIPAFAVPMVPRITDILGPGLANPLARRRAWLVLAFSVATAGLAWAGARRPRLGAALALAMVVPCWVIPGYGGVQNYPTVEVAELKTLSNWARANTPKDAVFAFPDAARAPDPGVFRAEAARAVYVCWKSGGQVNYMRGVGEEWWKRWHAIMAKKMNYSLVNYRAMGVDYVVVKPATGMAGRVPVFETPRHRVYRIEP